MLLNTSNGSVDTMRIKMNKAMVPMTGPTAFLTMVEKKMAMELTSTIFINEKK